MWYVPSMWPLLTDIVGDNRSPSTEALISSTVTVLATALGLKGRISTLILRRLSSPSVKKLYFCYIFAAFRSYNDIIIIITCYILPISEHYKQIKYGIEFWPNYCSVYLSVAYIFEHNNQHSLQVNHVEGKSSPGIYIYRFTWYNPPRRSGLTSSA